VTIVQEDFEGAFPGSWQVSDEYPGTGEFYWGKRNCRAYGGSYSGWAVGAGANGSGLTCGNNYPDDADSWMVYGPFSLVGATDADLNYKLWLNTESCSGGCDVMCALASIDGNNFYGTCAQGYSDGWVDRMLDLTSVYTIGDLRGKSAVWIAMYFYSDSSANYPEGAYIDNILLRKCPGGTCPGLLNTTGDNTQIIEIPFHVRLNR